MVPICSHRFGLSLCISHSFYEYMQHNVITVRFHLLPRLPGRRAFLCVGPPAQPAGMIFVGFSAQTGTVLSSPSTAFRMIMVWPLYFIFAVHKWISLSCSDYTISTGNTKRRPAETERLSQGGSSAITVIGDLP